VAGYLDIGRTKGPTSSSTAVERAERGGFLIGPSVLDRVDPPCGSRARRSSAGPLGRPRRRARRSTGIGRTVPTAMVVDLYSERLGGAPVQATLNAGMIGINIGVPAPWPVPVHWLEQLVLRDCISRGPSRSSLHPAENDDDPLVRITAGSHDDPVWKTGKAENASLDPAVGSREGSRRGDDAVGRRVTRPPGTPPPQLFAIESGSLPLVLVRHLMRIT